LHPGRARGAAAGVPPPASLAFAELGDPRIRLAGAATPGPGEILLRLQSFAEEPVSCPVRPHFPVAAAHAADWLGEAGREIPAGEGEFTVEVPALGTAAVLLVRP
ncbi:hypothetical protein P8605_26590, partial [Streptomyces sp. T-3]|nr:hypothetical protein [Streptomyces sp. T-3]